VVEGRHAEKHVWKRGLARLCLGGEGAFEEGMRVEDTPAGTAGPNTQAAILRVPPPITRLVVAGQCFE
jgi:hypothetical protein